MKQILIIDDEISVCTLLKNFFNKKGFETASVSSGKEAIAAVKNNHFDVIITDYFLQDTNGVDLFKNIKEFIGDTKVIFISGYSDVRIAVELLRMGAYHYLSKPLMPEQILAVVQEALENKTHDAIITNPPSEKQVAQKDEVADSEKDNQAKAEKKLGNDSEPKIIIGTSEVSLALEKNIHLVAPTNITVVIFGATGTGKEFVAKKIHNNSNRATKPYIPIDCGSLSKELAASELFGYEKGAFTGAVGAKSGAFEQANGGTIFLDEIGNLSLDVQMYLLRTIQERKVRRVGAVKTLDIDVRIIVASNENLLEKVKAGTFREDLYYRLNEFSISVPTLEARQADIPEFIEYFLKSIANEMGVKTPEMDKDVFEFLINYSYPGNIRQLQNIVKRLILLSQKSNKITFDMLPVELLNAESSESDNKYSSADFHNFPNQIMSNSIFFDKSKKNEERFDVNSLKDNAAKRELEIILNVLRHTNQNKSKAAKLLKIDRKTLYNKLAMLNEGRSGGEDEF